ncbi:methyltransferase [Candidatus Woesearchaeota archaeon]|nr:methyltransferase [Candidatus Woesearchaeota archaeon]
MVHYYDEKQKSKFSLRKFKARLRGNELEFYSGSGVFSKKKVDKGTMVLVENCIVKGDVLDMGCGIGVVGVAVKKDCPSCDVYMTDINKRAVKLARMNTELNKVKIKLFQGDLYEPLKGKRFNTILSNPPYTAGREVCYKIIEDAKKHLVDGGSLQLVARHQKGGKMLERKMEEIFGNVKELVKKSGYRVYLSEKG